MSVLMCPNCWSQQLRFSRFRLRDALWLIVLRMPVRCRECEVRFHPSVLRVRRQAARARRSERGAANA